ncbi:hypothetical protein HOLleu_10471 [Holothuria leucospilota]|uniref:Uncharacterized protein n=1 Tax=Holothuria leucospilota TaxID=206669 RepID=A0A9Q1H849_HOLLE|nr:hypothetical protein HOLleu_19926 [Holothuria leucospilota]KAJ8043405.1 hypothetical protein HOLleu_10471 [Holothuria leucospilota]
MSGAFVCVLIHHHCICPTKRPDAAVVLTAMDGCVHTLPLRERRITVHNLQRQYDAE